MPAFFLSSPAFAGRPFWVASPCPLAGTQRGATVGLFSVSSRAKSGFGGGCCYTPRNLTRTDLLRRSARATLEGRSRSTPSLSLAAARPVPSDPDRPPVDAGALLQSQIDERVVLQARFARLDRAGLPYLRGNTGPDRPRLTGSLLLAPIRVDFQQRLRALARRCGYRTQRTQRPLDRTLRGQWARCVRSRTDPRRRSAPMATGNSQGQNKPDRPAIEAAQDGSELLRRLQDPGGDPPSDRRPDTAPDSSKNPIITGSNAPLKRCFRRHRQAPPRPFASADFYRPLDGRANTDGRRGEDEAWETQLWRRWNVRESGGPSDVWRSYGETCVSTNGLTEGSNLHPSGRRVSGHQSLECWFAGGTRNAPLSLA